ncbi:MAG: sigma-70 family RNA polymerase sigma factor [Thermoanaerobacter sp.]|uniref:sigma-70 family RNA polymerase sigma factor n=1 Tax=Thermoanaerobacter sp. TaxID=1755 RepID=UPI003464D131
MTKYDLMQYRWILKNIEKIEEKLLEIDAQLQRITTRYTLVAVSRTGNRDVMGDLIIKKMEVEEEINKKLQESYKKLNEIEKAIKKLDEREKLLIRLRYIYGKSWAEICDEMNYSWAQIHRIHKEALEKLRKDETK